MCSFGEPFQLCRYEDMLNWQGMDWVNILLKRVFQTLKDSTQKGIVWIVVAPAGSTSPGVVCEDVERAANCLDNQMIFVIDWLH